MKNEIEEHKKLTADDLKFNRDLEYKKAWAEWEKTSDEKIPMKAQNDQIKSWDVYQSTDKEEEPSSSWTSFITYKNEVIKEPENFIFDEIEEFLIDEDKDKILSRIRTAYDNAPSREAELIVKLLYIFGESVDSNTNMKAEIIQAIIAKRGDDFSTIAAKYGKTRATASKIARDFIQRFPLFKITTAVRDEDFVNQCTNRAIDNHNTRKQDKEKAKKILMTKNK